MDKGDETKDPTSSPLGRFRQWIARSISAWPENFPHYLTAFFWLEARNGTRAIEGQLAIMRMAQAAFVWRKDQLLLPVYDDKKQQVTWDWYFENYGKSIAYILQLRSYMKIGDERYQPSYETLSNQTPEKSQSTILPPGQSRFKTAYSRPGISREYFEKMLNSDQKLGILVEIFYSGDPSGEDTMISAVCLVSDS